MAKPPFWSQGVRFECQGTGRCCMSRGQYGYVYLTLADRRRMAAKLGLKTEAFTRKYCKNTGGWFHLKNPDQDCAFLEGKGCTIYEARPAQCRTWPFWPENMNSKAWNGDIKKFCPGVGKGRLYSAEEIQSLMDQDPMNE